jgi:hypothetical protein
MQSENDIETSGLTKNIQIETRRNERQLALKKEREPQP